MKLSLYNKLFLGIAPAVILICVIVAFTLHRLNRLNHITRNITNIDQVVTQTAEQLLDVLLAQESYCQRYLILKSEDMLLLFNRRELEFTELINRLENLPSQNRPTALQEILTLKNDYRNNFDITAQYKDSTFSTEFLNADSMRRKVFDRQIEAIKSMALEYKNRQDKGTREAADISRTALRILIAISFLGIITSFFIAGAIANGIHGSVLTLRSATGLVSMNRLTNLPTVKTGDELGELSAAFNEMAKRLAQLEEIHMDSSPLTRLPGGIAVENIVKTHIENKIPFAFCMMDIDNFKPFNDRYGYGRGNDVIKGTAKIILECSREAGTKDDFIGHIGGDDFALLTTPSEYTSVCEKVIKRFDNEIAEFYDEEDRKRGYIISKSRQGETLKFPIMTISIAALDSEKSPVDNYIEVGEIIAELKKYAKKFQKSNLVVDRRGGKKKSVIPSEKKQTHS